MADDEHKLLPKLSVILNARGRSHTFVAHHRFDEVPKECVFMIKAPRGAKKGSRCSLNAEAEAPLRFRPKGSSNA
jgi:hypothetical protein